MWIRGEPVVHLTDTEMGFDYDQVDRLPNGEKKAALYILYGLTDDGAHHKQWCLEQAAKALDIDISAVNAWLDENGYAEIEPGIAP